MTYVTLDKCPRINVTEFKCMSCNQQKAKCNSSILDLTPKIEAVISETPKGSRERISILFQWVFCP